MNTNPHCPYVTNARNGACLMFDRRGRGLSGLRQRRLQRAAVAGALTNTLTAFRASLRSLVTA